MVEFVKKYVSLVDALILTLGIFWIVRLDFVNFGTMEKIYIGIFLAWCAMFCAKIYIAYRKSGGRK